MVKVLFKYKFSTFRFFAQIVIIYLLNTKWKISEVGKLVKYLFATILLATRLARSYSWQELYIRNSISFFSFSFNELSFFNVEHLNNHLNVMWQKNILLVYFCLASQNGEITVRDPRWLSDCLLILGKLFV